MWNTLFEACHSSRGKEAHQYYQTKKTKGLCTQKKAKNGCGNTKETIPAWKFELSLQKWSSTQQKGMYKRLIEPN